VVFPQMMRYALPGIGNNWMVMLKATALVSIIGLADLVKAAQDAGKSSYQLFYFLVLAALIYLLITSAPTSFCAGSNAATPPAPGRPYDDRTPAGILETLPL
jgi:histidine transport system permease protein